MDIKIMGMTSNPEELILRCARNDYYDGNVATDSFEEVMSKVKGSDLEDKKLQLLKKTMMRGHHGVFEHATITLHASMSRACMAQITRHRFISFDIQSMRYVNFNDPTMYVPEKYLNEDEVHIKSRSGTTTVDSNEVEDIMRRAYTDAVDAYNQLIGAGMPPEDARHVLPIGTMVNVTMTMNMRTMLHIISMRGAGDAQDEVRDLADGLLEALSVWCPMVYSLWVGNKGAIERQRLTP